MVCLTRDFYDIIKEEWRTSDLLLLKSAMETIGLDVYGKMSYEKFVRQVGTNHDLYQHLIGEDFKVNQLATGNELLAVSVGKMDKPIRNPDRCRMICSSCYEEYHIKYNQKYQVQQYP